MLNPPREYYNRLNPDDAGLQRRMLRRAPLSSPIPGAPFSGTAATVNATTRPDLNAGWPFFRRGSLSAEQKSACRVNALLRCA
jgi:hypothetical protein